MKETPSLRWGWYRLPAQRSRDGCLGNPACGGLLVILALHCDRDSSPACV